MAERPPRLGKVQLDIMRVLWRRGKATAREITDDLSAAKPIAHSTVQTLLRKLEVKGAVCHVVEDRTFVFHPLYEENSVRETATRDLLARVFGGSAYGLVSHLLRNENISQEELACLRQLIDEERPK